MHFKTITFLFALALLSACAGKTESGVAAKKDPLLSDTSGIEPADPEETMPEAITEEAKTDKTAVETDAAVTESTAEKKSVLKVKPIKAILTRKWVVTELAKKSISSKRKKEYFIDFLDKDHRFTAYAGCNQMSGTYKVEGNSITFSDVMQTKMACENMEDERELSSVLSDARYFSIDAGKLQLMNARKNVLAEFN